MITIKTEYIKFKKNNLKALFPNETDTYYEEKSFGANPLFFNVEKLDFDSDIPDEINNAFLTEAYSELLSLEHKFGFLKSYLQTKVKNLEGKSLKLDEDFSTLCNSRSFMADSMLNMFDTLPEGQTVKELSTLYIKNAIFDGDKIIKVKEDKKELKSMLKIDSSQVLRYVLTEKSKIDQVVINSSKSCIVNIFGKGETGEFINLKNSLDTETDSVFIIPDSSEFKEIMIISNENIKHFISNVKFYSFETSTKDIDINSIIIYENVAVDEAVKYAFSNHNNTVLYSIAPENVNAFIKDCEFLSFSELKNKYFSSFNKIEKNVFYDVADCEYIIELMGIGINETRKLMAFGIEEE